MRTVNRFDHNLLQILFAIFEQNSDRLTVKLLDTGFATGRPKCLSRETVELVEQTITKGCIKWLVEVGGWQVQTHMVNEETSEGRLWERHKPQELGLTFSERTIDFLIHLTAKSTNDKSVWGTDAESLTLGDQFFFFMVANSFHNLQFAKTWSKREFFSKNPLIALSFPNLFSAKQAHPDIDFRPWMKGIGAAIFETCQDFFASRIYEIEKSKFKTTDPKIITNLARDQRQVWQRLFSACENNDRRDLCRFLQNALGKIIHPKSKPEDWTGKLETNDMRIADRFALYRDAMVLTEAIDQLKKWQSEGAITGYFDEGYAASQLFKSDWETFNTEKTVEFGQKLNEFLNF